MYIMALNAIGMCTTKEVICTIERTSTVIKFAIASQPTHCLCLHVLFIQQFLLFMAKEVTLELLITVNKIAIALQPLTYSCLRVLLIFLSRLLQLLIFPSPSFNLITPCHPLQDRYDFTTARYRCSSVHNLPSLAPASKLLTQHAVHGAVYAHTMCLQSNIS